MQFEIAMSTRRYLPPSGTAGFERCCVSGNRRVPAPPPRITASTLCFAGIWFEPTFGFGNQREHRRKVATVSRLDYSGLVLTTLITAFRCSAPSSASRTNSIAGGIATGSSSPPKSDPGGAEQEGDIMAQTFVSLMVHVIFSTKNREPFISPEVEPELFAYIGGILKNHESRLLNAGGTSDHVHLLISQSKNIALSTLLKEVKKSSSFWLKTKGNKFRNFHWQDGYGGFSIGQSNLSDLNEYIANQREHHRRRSFQEELIQFLKAYGIEYDERYLWN
jgi:putative transposase